MITTTLWKPLLVSNYLTQYWIHVIVGFSKPTERPALRVIMMISAASWIIKNIPL